MPDLDRRILELLPESNNVNPAVSTSDLHEKLSAFGQDPPVLRTVARHLKSLLDQGLIEETKHGRASLWLKCPGANGVAGKKDSKMTFDEALALKMLGRFASRQIPSLVTTQLNGLFSVADARLKKINAPAEQRYARWADKIAVQKGGFTLRYPVINTQIYAAASHALFDERKLVIVYRPRNDPGNTKSKVVLPLGLVEVGGLVYLVGGTQGKRNPTMYRLDRMSSAEASFEPFTYPADFSLNAYVSLQREFDFMVEGEVRIKLCFKNGCGDHLEETGLSEDQVITRVGDALIVEGTVMLSHRLQWWVRAFGPDVEVLEPKSLRAKLADDARALSTLYLN